MHAGVAPLYEIFKLNTRLFLNCLRDVDDENARQRAGAANNMAFIALHLLDARCYLARTLGIEYRMPYADMLDSVSNIDEVEQYPPLKGVRDSWRLVSDLLVDRLAALDAADVARVAPLEFPVDDGTLLGGIAFLVQHESSHIGQLAFLRRYLGLAAMSYDPD
ncbi:MAG: DinB family protein [Gemmatimonadota bacterium]|nr:MAG: DinB family protein [Gemmatimonadota bacterium]